MSLKFISLCSGIEAASVAWEPLGWEAIALAEIEPHAAAVLAHRWPQVPNLGDITKVNWSQYRGKADIVIGGTPCQGFSQLGSRAGLNDPRSNLALTFVEAIAAIRPRWFIWENVPGVLSSDEGHDFAGILGCFSGRAIGVPSGGWKNAGVIDGIPDAYGLSWRILDSQYFGVPQARRRVFLVGHLGDWRPSTSVLFDREGDPWNPPAIAQTQQDRPVLLDRPLVAFRGKKNIDSVNFNLSPTITAGGHLNSWANSGNSIAIANEDVCRWLSPIEVERCFGFPDNYTAVPWKSDMMLNGPRHKMAGNSIAVPVLRWLGDRIQEVHFNEEN